MQLSFPSPSHLHIPHFVRNFGYFVSSVVPFLILFFLTLNLSQKPYICMYNIPILNKLIFLEKVANTQFPRIPVFPCCKLWEQDVGSSNLSTPTIQRNEWFLNLCNHRDYLIMKHLLILFSILLLSSPLFVFPCIE